MSVLYILSTGEFYLSSNFPQKYVSHVNENGIYCNQKNIVKLELMLDYGKGKIYFEVSLKCSIQIKAYFRQKSCKYLAIGLPKFYTATRTSHIQPLIGLCPLTSNCLIYFSNFKMQ